MRTIKTKYRVTAPKKVWRSILQAMDLYPTHNFHFDSDLGAIVRWDGRGEDAGKHVQEWRMKVTGRLNKRFSLLFVVLQKGPSDEPDYSWDNHTHWPIRDAKEWIESHLLQDDAPAILYDYNTETASTTSAKEGEA